VSRRQLPQADMTIEDNPNPAREEESLEDDDVEDDTYVPSPRAPIHGRGKGLASASGSGAARDEEIEEEAKEYNVMRRKKCLMLRKSFLRHMLT
jgi:hypothetical protein